MKTILLFINLIFFFINVATAQDSLDNYIVTAHGFRSEFDTSKNYLVVNFPNKSAKQIYDKAINFIKEVYKNPSFVLTSAIDSEYVRYETHVAGMAKAKIPVYGTYLFDADFTVELRFKSGKLRFEIIQHKFWNSQWGSSLDLINSRTTWTGGSLFYIYNKDLSLKQAKAKEEIEKYFKNYISEIYSYVNNAPSNDW